MRFIPILFFGLFMSALQAQDYFPPLTGTEWETMEPIELSYCQERIDSLYAFLDSAGTKSFILLKDGRMVLEHYFGTYTQDSLWYWASAGKSLASVLVGCAQEDGLLNIEDPTSDYLGLGWTSAPPDKEALITIRHQLSMSTGLADNTVDGDCLDPECLTYQVDAGERWSYYNAPYRLTTEVLEAASGMGINLYTHQRLGNRIGMGGLWFEHVRFGKARDMARFGLLALNNGNWDGDAVLADMDFLNDMSTQSQDFNEAYGYLWWLNGTNTFMLPQSQIVWPGELTSNAPDDMYSALGKNDQKIYVIPSEGMVVVRQGNDAGEATAGPSFFDNSLWQKINELVCIPDGLIELNEHQLKLAPNPALEALNIISEEHVIEWEIIDLAGRVIRNENIGGKAFRIDLQDLLRGTYVLRCKHVNGWSNSVFNKE